MQGLGPGDRMTYHEQATVRLAASANAAFEFVDDPRHLAGHMTKREMHIPYQHLDRVMHERAGAHLGYLQFATKPGTPGHSQLHRSKIHFGQHHAHDFKRAKDLIDEQVMVAQEAAEKGPAKDAEPPMVNPYTGDVIPR